MLNQHALAARIFLSDSCLTLKPAAKHTAYAAPNVRHKRAQCCIKPPLLVQPLIACNRLPSYDSSNSTACSSSSSFSDQGAIPNQHQWCYSAEARRSLASVGHALAHSLVAAAAVSPVI
jgi:hypothetical protein